MIKIRQSQIAQILPEYLSQRTEVKCLSYAINKAMLKFIDYCGDIGVFAMIDSAPDEVLDLLAVELNTQYYDTSLATENKRELIKGTLTWYLTSGTPSAVEELIAAVFGEGSVQEWFEYGDSPYYFKITTNAQLTPDIIDRFTQIIRRVKNARSHIRQIEIHRNIDWNEYPAVGVISEPRVTVTNNKNSSSGITGTENIAAGVYSETGSVITNNAEQKTATLNGSAKYGMAVMATPHIRIESNS